MLFNRMVSSKYLTSFVLCLLGFAFGEDSLLKPCKISDFKCVGESAQIFLEKSSLGIPKYGIVPIDPIIIPFLEFDLETMEGVHILFFYTTVTGIKNLRITKLEMDEKKERVTLSVNLETQVRTSINVSRSVNGKQKMFGGNVEIGGKTNAIAKYKYSVIINKEGIKYFNVGKEKIKYSIDQIPTKKYDVGIAEAINNDPDWADFREKANDSLKFILKKIMEVAFPNVITNLREIAKVLPKSAFVES